MTEKIMKKYTLSEKGAKDLIKGCIACAVQNIVLVLPVGSLYMLIKDLIEKNDVKQHSAFFIVSAIICFALAVITGWFSYNATYTATYKESKVRRISIAEKLRKIPLSYFEKKDLADLSDAIMTDCQAMEVAFSHNIPSLYGSLISSFITAVVLFFIDWRMGAAAFWVLPVSLIIVLSSFKMQKKMNARSVNARAACSDGIQEFIEVMRDIKSCNAENEYIKCLDRKIDTLEKEEYYSKFGITAFVMSAGIVLKFGIVSVVITGSALLLGGSIDFLTFLLFLLMISRMYDPLISVLQNMSAIVAVHSNIERTREILEYRTQGGSDRLTNNGYDIVFDDVTFSYKDGKNVLNGVSFTAEQGKVTALVGSSGGGKTTASRLVTRFWDADKGRITVGGMNVSDVEPETLMSLYSMVFQNVTLFNDTIMENIRIGRKGATDEEVLRAAAMANCNEIAERLPDKWNSMVGENGCELSGGERQRISIARAFLKDAPVILLDEATASLDVENETYVQSALSRLISNKTVIVIAHRMRTVENADKIVVLSEGKVAEEGTAQELMERNGIFAKMASLQKSTQNWSVERRE